MSFRYSGLGVGHRSTWEATRVFREEIWQAFKLPLALLDPDSTSNLNNNEDDSTGNSDMSDMQSDADPDDLLQEDVLAVMTADEGDSSDDETVVNRTPVGPGKMQMLLGKTQVTRMRTWGWNQTWKMNLMENATMMITSLV